MCCRQSEDNPKSWASSLGVCEVTVQKTVQRKSFSTLLVHLDIIDPMFDSTMLKYILCETYDLLYVYRYWVSSYAVTTKHSD